MRARAIVAFSIITLLAAPAWADDPIPGNDSPFTEEELATSRARTAFRRGNDHVAEGDWAAALESFEESFALRPHPVTQYNIGIAQRALGQYTRARRSFKTALAAHKDSLPASLREQALTLLDEVEQIVVHVELTVLPATSDLAVDGRPLEKEGDNVLVAGTLSAGKGQPIGEGTFEVILDPGTHLFLLTRKGFSDAVVNRTFRPGSRQELKLEIDRLPATIRVESAQEKARVTVDGADVGFAPVEVPRPAGTYVVEVTKDGFISFSTRVTLEAGGESRLRVPLVVRTQPLAEKWWFWTIVGSATAVVVTGVAVGTYYATREPAAPNGGTLGWTIDLR